MPKSLAQEIFKIIQERAGGQIDFNDRLDNIGLDSLDFAELCLDLEERYDIQSELRVDFYQSADSQTTDLASREQIPTVKQFIDYVLDQKSRKEC